MKLLAEQYKLVKNSREVLLKFCESISNDHFLQPQPAAGKSIRDLLVHIANCYQAWLENFINHKKYPEIKPEAVMNANDMRQFFDRTDHVVANFLNRYESSPLSMLHGKFPNEEQLWSMMPLNLFTHVITHEFHHKGQILMMARTFGYTPPDTDIIRTSRKSS